MKVLVDTSVWSLAFRRRAPVHPVVAELRTLIGCQLHYILLVHHDLLQGPNPCWTTLNA